MSERMSCKLCIICGKENAAGHFEDEGICSVCGDIIDDIIFMYIHDTIDKSKKDATDRAHYVDEDTRVEWLLGYLDEVVPYLQYFESDKEGKLHPQREKYYDTFAKVTGWLKANKGILKQIFARKYSLCSHCKQPLKKMDLVQNGNNVEILCGHCRKVIVRYMSPISHLP